MESRAVTEYVRKRRLSLTTLLAIVAFLLLVLLGSQHYLGSQDVKRSFPTKAQRVLADCTEEYKQMDVNPDDGADTSAEDSSDRKILVYPWINSEPLLGIHLRDNKRGDLCIISESLRDKVILIDFWEYTCVNCLRTLPYLKEWHKRYSPYGLVIIGVHTPEFSFGGDTENLKAAVKRLGIEYPVVSDSDYAIWNALQNQYWPRKFILDKDHKFVYDHVGEGGYGETEAKIQELLHQLDPSLKFPALMEALRPEDKPGSVCYRVTPELYCGYKRAHFGNVEEYPSSEATETYRDSGELNDGAPFLNGRWKITPESSVLAEDNKNPEAYIRIYYHAVEVNAVMHAPEPTKVYVYLNGKAVPAESKGDDIEYDEGRRSFIIVSDGRMYRIASQQPFGNYDLKLIPTQPNFEIFAYTFGSCEIPKE